jgi:hypothetical protein
MLFSGDWLLVPSGAGFWLPVQRLPSFLAFQPPSFSFLAAEPRTRNAEPPTVFVNMVVIFSTKKI